MALLTSLQKFETWHLKFLYMDSDISTRFKILMTLSTDVSCPLEMKFSLILSLLLFLLILVSGVSFHSWFLSVVFEVSLFTN